MRIWLMDVGGAGFRAQTQGLGRAIAARRDGSQIHIRPIRRNLFSRLLPGLSAPHSKGIAKTIAESIATNGTPDLLIACGRDAVFPALQVKRHCGAFAVYIQRPADSTAFDAVICGLHDRLTGEHVLPIVGSVGPVNSAILRQRRGDARIRFAAVPEPRTCVFIGGANRAFALTPRECRRLAERLCRAIDGGMLVSTSRRTGAQNTAALAEAFAASGKAHYFFDAQLDGKDDNPYTDMLAAADRLVVTGDSVNMLSEACGTGKPVYILPLRSRMLRWGAASKFAAFHRQLTERNCARIWPPDTEQCTEQSTEPWQPTPLAETDRAADFVLHLYDKRNAG